MTPTRLGLLLAAIGAACILACNGRSATDPEFDSACTADQQSGVRIENDTRVTELYLTREYTTAEIIDNSNVRTHFYRVCQTYTCRVVRTDPAAPLTDTEVSEAITACRAEADAFWRTHHTL